MIKLIINADDFGMSKVFNEKILDLLGRGFVKSTTVMVGEVTKEQDSQIRRLKELRDAGGISVGLHLEFDPTKPVGPQVEEQHQGFISMFGFPPSHLDFHKPRGMKETQFEELMVAADKFAREHNLPARNRMAGMTAKHTTYPAFLCQDITMELDAVIDFLKSVKEGSSCELITHPGDYDPDCKSSRNRERRIDYDSIIKLQDFLKQRPNIKNISYHEL